MRNRVAFSIVAAVVLLASTNASGLNLDGRATQGVFSINSTFGPYAPCVAPVVCAGTGTNTISWGTPSDVDSTSSSLQETVGPDFNNVHVGGPVQAGGPIVSGDAFVIGYLKFINGTTVSGTGGTINVHGNEILDVYLKLSTVNVVIAGTQVPDPSIPSHNADLILHLTAENTPNTPDPLNPDIITILNGLFRTNGNQYNQFNVPEGKSGTVEILALFNSLDPAGFGRVVAGEGFVSSSAIPEPSSLVLVGGGLIALVFARPRKGLRRPDIGRR